MRYTLWLLLIASGMNTAFIFPEKEEKHLVLMQLVQPISNTIICGSYHRFTPMFAHWKFKVFRQGKGMEIVTLIIPDPTDMARWEEGKIYIGEIRSIPALLLEPLTQQKCYFLERVL